MLNDRSVEILNVKNKFLEDSQEGSMTKMMTAIKFCDSLIVSCVFFLRLYKKHIKNL